MSLRRAQTKKVAAILIVALATAIAATAYYFWSSSLSAGSPAAFDQSNSYLLLDGLVDQALNLSLEELKLMPKTTINASLYCLPSLGSSGVLIDSGNWSGIKLSYLLQFARMSSEAIKIAFYAEDGFKTDLTVAAAMCDEIIIAYEKDGRPLREKSRLVASGMWGYKWIATIKHIEAVDYDFKGTYESRGFPDDARISGATECPF